MKLFNTVYSGIFSDFAHMETVARSLRTVVNPEDMIDHNSLLILHGGEDISPSLYGEKPNGWCGAATEPSRRDRIEKNLFSRAVELGIPILGICRGAQLACALNGGSLVQHVENHTKGRHQLELSSGEIITTNSYHHQMMVPWKTNHDLLGWSAQNLSKNYLGELVDGVPKQLDMKKEPEIVWFKDSNTLAVQGHPEWLAFNHPLVQFVIKTLKERM